jgi:4-amino-4-deoxy-L-arabinose transferase-like glycosyltransferase
MSTGALPRAAALPRRVLAGRGLLAIVVLALVARLVVVGASAHVAPRYDAADYDRVALSISAGDGYPPTTYAAAGTPSAFRPPAWPYALAAAYKATGKHWIAGRALAALLGTVAVLLVALIARELWARRAALIAGAVAAVLPPLIALNASLLSEALFVPAMLGMIWALLRARRSAHAWRWLLGAGVLAGLAILTRSDGLVLLVPLAAGAFWAARGRAARRALAPALAVLVAVAVLVPWTVRNLDAFSTFVPISTQGGPTLAGTYNAVAAHDDKYQGANRVPAQVPALRRILARGDRDEAQLDGRFTDFGLTYAAAHPGYVAKAMGLNTLRLVDLSGHRWLTRLSYEEMGVPPGIGVVVSVSVLALLVLAVAGAAALVRDRHLGGRRVGPAWLWATPVLLWVTIVPVTGAPRYGTVLDPFGVLLCAAALGAWLGRHRRHPGLAA